MPVLEAGLAGIPVLSRHVPAAEELARNESVLFNADTDPETVAVQLIQMLENSPAARLRRRVRKHYTWQAIFNEDIRPLLNSDKEF